jgi:hypothetical protein
MLVLLSFYLHNAFRLSMCCKKNQYFLSSLANATFEHAVSVSVLPLPLTHINKALSYIRVSLCEVQGLHFIFEFLNLSCTYISSQTFHTVIGLKSVPRYPLLVGYRYANSKGLIPFIYFL